MIREKHSSSNFGVIATIFMDVQIFWDTNLRRQVNTCTLPLTEKTATSIFRTYLTV